jgi:DnaK suppressor protein
MATNPILTDEQLLNSSEDDYMNESQLETFKQKLQHMLKGAEQRISELQTELFAISNREPDENDLATVEEERRMTLRMHDRETKLVSKIQASLRRIADGSYGYCEETGKPIGIARLLARPTATLSTEAKIDQEKIERIYRENAD